MQYIPKYCANVAMISKLFVGVRVWGYVNLSWCSYKLNIEDFFHNTRFFSVQWSVMKELGGSPLSRSHNKRMLFQCILIKLIFSDTTI